MHPISEMQAVEMCDGGGGAESGSRKERGVGGGDAGATRLCGWLLGLVALAVRAKVGSIGEPGCPLS